jgi:ubiquinone/menaquinone biosynthesis C-methylase UbiE
MIYIQNMENFKSQIQVDKNSYLSNQYLSQGRWFSYFNQIKNVMSVSKIEDKILEVGKGNGIVSNTLRSIGFTVKTIDIDASLEPDVVGSVEKMPLENSSFDVVLAAEILEHLPFGLFKRSLEEIGRISRKYAIISLPHIGVVFKMNVKIPFIKEFAIFFKIPYFWKRHVFNGQHYWEIGKSGFQISKIKKQILDSGWKIERSYINKDDPSHWHCILKKS